MSALYQRSLIAGIQSAYAASLWPAARAFNKHCRQPAQIQALKLQNLLKYNANTEYGRKYDFARIKTVAEYQAQLPIVDYDDLAPWIDSVAQGKSGVLTQDPVLMLERTSGSTRANKLIPYTQGLLNEFSAATYAWQWDLYRQFPGLLSKRAYWSISPSFKEQQTTSGGVPIGFEDDTEYFNPVMRWALSQCLAVDGGVKHLHNMDEWRLQTAIQLLRCDDLGLISVWSPTFIVSLLQFIADNIHALQCELTSRRQRERLSAAADGQAINAELLWPHLQLLSCWSDGISEQFTTRLRDHFPSVCIQGKGLMATEGVVSLPLLDFPSRTDSTQISHGGVAAIASHFMEFIALDCPDHTPVLAHQLEVDKQYSPVISTAGGLYRYHLKDVVTCFGYRAGAPILEFNGKYDAVSDVCGEKLNATLVTRYLLEQKQNLDIQSEFNLLAPRAGLPTEYVLYIESTASNSKLQTLAEQLEACLLESHHYRYARDLNQLRPISWQRVTGGWQTYQNALLSRGLRLGDIKPSCLDNRCDWYAEFTPRCFDSVKEANI